jgi:DNA-binding response OmpR family regulator
VGKPEKKVSRIMMVAGASRLATMVEMRLSRQGYQVDTFAGAKSALGRLGEDRPDAIFLDVSLPEKHVAMVFEELKKTAVTKDIPVVLFSPQSGKEALESAVTRWEAKDYISSASDLGDVLRKLKEEAAK